MRKKKKEKREGYFFGKQRGQLGKDVYGKWGEGPNDTRNCSLSLVKRKREITKKNKGRRQQETQKTFRVGYRYPWSGLKWWWFKCFSSSAANCRLSMPAPYADDGTAIGPDGVVTPFKNKEKGSVRTFVR
jgi:hypothetical protein